MSLIKQLAQIADNEQLWQDMLEQICEQAVEHHTASHAIDLAEAMAQPNVPGQPNVGDIVIKIDPAAVKTFIITSIAKDKAVARNPRDGEQISVAVFELNDATKADDRPVQRAAQRITVKFPNRSVWTSGDVKAKADNKQTARKQLTSVIPQFDDKGGIKMDAAA